VADIRDHIQGRVERVGLEHPGDIAVTRDEVMTRLSLQKI
jgi:sRNA-binding carbon storage regulator CsrA